LLVVRRDRARAKFTMVSTLACQKVSQRAEQTAPKRRLREVLSVSRVAVEANGQQQTFGKSPANKLSEKLLALALIGGCTIVTVVWIGVLWRAAGVLLTLL
jgi:hypothetical protein